MRRLLALGLALASCSSDRTHRLAVTGAAGSPTAARRAANVLYATATTAGGGGELLVDTGAPVTVLAPARFAVGAGPIAVDALAAFGLSIARVPALGVALFPDEPGLPAGLLGGSLLCQFAVTLDYRARAVTLGASAPAAMGGDGLAAPIALPFSLEGGGDAASAGTRFHYPATRVPILVTVEGVASPMVLDSGASYVVLRDARWRALAADGRARLDGVPIESANGTLGASLTRAKAISVGAGEDAQSLDAVPVLDIGDDLLDGFAAEVGHPVDGLLGGAFLRAFRVTVDYPAGALRLARYSDGAPIDPDEFHQVGLTLDFAPAGAAHRYVVGHVYVGTDAAAQGIAAGTTVVAVDGAPLDALPLDEAEQTLRAPAGTIKRLTLPTGDVSLRVDDLLP